jgi:hypothetical protein
MSGDLVCTAGPMLALFNNPFTRGLADLVVVALACLGLYYLWMLVTGRAPAPGAMREQVPPPPPPPVQPYGSQGSPPTNPPAARVKTSQAPEIPPAQSIPVSSPAQSPVSATKPPTIAATPAQETFDAELVSIIAAAVACVLDRPHRVLDIRKVTGPGAWVNPWAIEGRFQHYSSHKVR